MHETHGEPTRIGTIFAARCDTPRVPLSVIGGANRVIFIAHFPELASRVECPFMVMPGDTMTVTLGVDEKLQSVLEARLS